MKKITKSLTLLLIAFSSTSLFHESIAEDKRQGFYGFGGLSYNKITDIEGTVGSTKVDIKNSPAVGNTIGIGYDFGNTWKTDFTWFRTYAYFDKATVGSTSVNLTGRFQVNSFILGVTKDLIEDGNTPNKFTPYVGAGAGIGKLYSKEGLSINGINSGKINGDYDFVYAFKAGVDYAVNNYNDIYGEVKWIGYNSEVDGTITTESGGGYGVEIGYKWKF